MGFTPCELARLYGPFPDTESVLVQVALKLEFESRRMIVNGTLSTLQCPALKQPSIDDAAGQQLLASRSTIE